MLHVRRAVACCGALTVALISLAGPARAATPASVTSANAAVAWLETQQQPDGGFEVAGYGIETRDATLAVAEHAQTGAAWSTSQALAAVQALKAGGSGPTPLDYLEQDPGVFGAGGSAAKTIVLTTAPLGLDPTSFGSPTPANLVTLMGGCSASSDPAFNGLLYILLAEHLVCGSMSSVGVAAVRAAQQPDGGWNYVGDPTAGLLDPDTTALALQVLVAAGADSTDAAVANGLTFFATNQQASGAWQSFATDDPNSTALSILAIAASGYDVESPCWRDTFAPGAAGSAYASPTAWLRSQQVTSGVNAGQIQSPNDAYGVNTFATVQAVQGLLQSWLPGGRADAVTCSLPPTPTASTTTPVAGGSVTLTGGGFAASTTLTVELHSTPVVLATIESDVYGNYSTTVVIPSDTTPGSHDLVVSGLDPDGRLRTESVSITVLASGSSSSSSPSSAPVADAAAAAVPVAASVSPRFTG